MASPFVSVIVPIYNQERYLREYLDSILLQNIDDIEVLCINDGSTDGSFNILSEYAWIDGRVKVLGSCLVC